MDQYYNPKTGLSSAYKIYKGQNELTLDQVKAKLGKYEPYQLNKQLGKIAYFPILGHGKHSYQADLMFLDKDDGYNSILCIINVITRYAYVYPLKKKSDIKNDSELVEDTYRSMKKFYNDVPDIEHLQTDAGSEFVNSKVKDLFKDIDYYSVDSNTAQGKVERFNQTLRRLITVYQSAYNTTKWVSVLPDLLYNYNHRFHRSLGCSPADCDEDEQFAKEMDKYQIANQKVATYKKGDRVRILLNKDLFDKGRAEWSPQIYFIDKVDGHRLIVNGKPYQYYQLQKVQGVHKKLFNDAEDELIGDVVDKKAIKKEKKVVRDLNKEGVKHYNNPGLKETEIVGPRTRGKVNDKDYVGKSYRKKFGKTFYNGKVIEYEPPTKGEDASWIVEYDQKIKSRDIIDGYGKLERVLTKTELLSHLV